MWIAWALITAGIVLLSTSQLLAYIVSFSKYPDAMREVMKTNKSTVILGIIFHVVVHIVWIVLIFSIEAIHKELTAIAITFFVMMIFAVPIAFKNHHEVVDDIKNLAKPSGPALSLSDAVMRTRKEQTEEELERFAKKYDEFELDSKERVAVSMFDGAWETVLRETFLGIAEFSKIMEIVWCRVKNNHVKVYILEPQENEEQQIMCAIMVLCDKTQRWFTVEMNVNNFDNPQLFEWVIDENKAKHIRWDDLPEFWSYAYYAALEKIEKILNKESK